VLRGCWGGLLREGLWGWREGVLVQGQGQGVAGQWSWQVCCMHAAAGMEMIVEAGHCRAQETVL
jgi:hypothetical protein